MNAHKTLIFATVIAYAADATLGASAVSGTANVCDNPGSLSAVKPGREN